MAATAAATKSRFGRHWLTSVANAGGLLRSKPKKIWLIDVGTKNWGGGIRVIAMPQATKAAVPVVRRTAPSGSLLRATEYRPMATSARAANRASVSQPVAEAKGD